MRPNLLFITSRDPYAEHGGDRIRARSLVAALLDAYNVTVWCIGEGGQLGNAAGKPANVRVRHFETDKRTQLRSILRHALNRSMPIQVAMYQVPALHRACADQGGEFDVVVCHLIRTAPYLAHFRCLRVLDYCDAVSSNAAQTASQAGWWSPWGWLNALEAPRARRYEFIARHSADLLTVASHVDRDLLALPQNRTLLIPQGTNLPPAPNSTIAPSHKVDAPTVLFIGKMDYFPNLDAAKWFCKNVLGLLPEVKLRIVGPVSDSGRESLQHFARVEVLGRVDSLADAAAGCAIAIAPMRVATGMQTKVLDYLALGLPTVASPIATRGLPVEPTVAGITMANSPEEWAQSIRDLLGSAEQRERLRTQGLQYVSEWHDWKVIGKKLSDRLAAELRSRVPKWTKSASPSPVLN